jgi:hypothetical protein
MTLAAIRERRRAAMLAERVAALNGDLAVSRLRRAPRDLVPLGFAGAS